PKIRIKFKILFGLGRLRHLPNFQAPGLRSGLPPGVSADPPMTGAAMTAATQLSILIPVFNERQLLPFLLQKVYSVLPELRREIILVDDCSTDGTREWLRENFGTGGVLTGFAKDPGGSPRPVISATEPINSNQAPVRALAVFHAQNQ